MRNCTSEQARLALRARRSELVPAARASAERAARLVGRGRRSQARAAAGRLRTRRVPLVLGAAADPLVVAGPAHGAVSGRIRRLAQPAQDFAQRPVQHPRRWRLRRHHQGVRGSPPLRRRHLAQCRDDRLVRAAARLGFGHSVETYHGDRLVGGLYGIQLGRVFFGESMFSRRAGRLQGRPSRAWSKSAARATSSSSIARSRARIWRASGAREVSRNEFVALLSRLARRSPRGSWAAAQPAKLHYPGALCTMRPASCTPQGRMSKEEAIQFEGEVVETLPEHHISGQAQDRPRGDRAHFGQDAQELHPDSDRAIRSPSK